MCHTPELSLLFSQFVLKDIECLLQGVLGPVWCRMTSLTANLARDEHVTQRNKACWGLWGGWRRWADQSLSVSQEIELGENEVTQSVVCKEINSPAC